MNTVVLQQASEVLGRQQWPAEGELYWCGWGEPSAELAALMPGRWVTGSTESPGPQTAKAGTIGSGPHAGAHLMAERLAAGRAERLDRLRRVHDEVAAGGLLAVTYPVCAPAGATAVVGHQRLIEELLEATSGRVLTNDLVVHQPDSVGMTWATLVLRCLR